MLDLYIIWSGIIGYALTLDPHDYLSSCFTTPSRFPRNMLVSFTLASCAPEKRKADISDSDLEVKIGRFDQDFWAMKGQPCNTKQAPVLRSSSHTQKTKASRC